jgi:hypothetical protein
MKNQNQKPGITTYSEAEKQLARDYPNFTETTWKMVKNVNLVMQIMLGLFVVQTLVVFVFILSKM